MKSEENLLKIKDFKHNCLYDLDVTTKGKYKLKKTGELKENNKLSILSDSMFKAMFYNSKRIKYSCKLISYFIDISYEKLLKNITLTKSEFDKTEYSSSGIHGDFVANINDTFINIEINNNKDLDTLYRNIKYVDRLYDSITKNNSSKYSQVIQLNINNFKFKKNSKIKDIYGLMNDEGILLTNKKIIINIYVPNLLDKWYNEGIEKLEDWEKFILCLVDDNSLLDDLGDESIIMKEYNEEARVVSRDADLLESYDKEEALKEEFYNEGVEDGIEKGHASGLAEGHASGRAEEKKEIAKNLLGLKIPVKDISKATGLSIKEIESLN